MNEHERPRPLRWAHEEPAAPGAWAQLSVILPSSVIHELSELAKAEKRTLSRQAWEFIARGLAQAETSRRLSHGR